MSVKILDSGGEELFELGPKDSAFVFREDGSEEMSIPNSEDDELICESAMKILVVATLFSGRPKAEVIMSSLEEIAMECIGESKENDDGDPR